MVKDNQFEDNTQNDSSVNDEDDVDRISRSEDGEDTSLTKPEEELAKVIEERDKYLAMAQRIQADFDNYKKRNKTSIAAAYNDAELETVGKFLPVLDNLHRALDISGEKGSSHAEAICKGVEMVTKQFTDILEKMGITEIGGEGEPFDPMYHDAVMSVEAESEEEKNTVTEVVLMGYKTEDKVIRYSMVKVAN